jgi:hypothetical protein
MGFQESQQLMQTWGDPTLQGAGALGSACWCQLGAMAAAAGMGEPSLWLAGALGSTCRHRLPGATAAAGTGELSMQAVGILEPDCWHGLWEYSTVALLPA